MSIADLDLKPTGLREFKARQILGSTPRFRRMWTTKFTPLNQNELTSGRAQSAACAFTTLMGAEPVKYPVSVGNAEVIARLARGNSILDVAEGCMRAKLFNSFVWMLNPDEIVDWVVRRSPVVLGSPWIFTITDTGYLYHSPDLPVSIGRVPNHAVAITGYWPDHSKFGDVLVVTNSWGAEWGLRGKAFLPVSALQGIWDLGAEAMAPIGFPPKRTGDK